MKNNGLEKQYFVEGHHVPIIDKEGWLLAQQIRTERRYSKKRARKQKPRIVVKGPLAGFIIVDPTWPADEADSIFASLTEKQTLSPTPLPEDKNIIIVKE